MPRTFLFLLILLLPACTPTKPTRVILVGGAGLSQLGDLGSTITAMCPDADVIETGGWDGFRGDPLRTAITPPCQAVILIGHSFGCQTVAAAAAQLQSVDLVIMIDPSWDDITIPPSVKSCLWYRRADDGGMERRAIIHNGGAPITVAGDHNDICHNPQLMQEVARIIQNISDRKALQQRLQNLPR